MKDTISQVSLDTYLQGTLLKIYDKYRTLQSEVLKLDPGSTNYVQHLKKINKLEPLAIIFQKITKLQETHNEFLELDSIEPLSPEYREECEVLKQEILDSHEFAKNLLTITESKKNEIVSIFLEIRAGSGGLEASLFCAELSQMYLNYCLSQGWHTEILNISHSEFKGYREITIKIEGDAVYTKLQYESGVHRVQRVPATESQGRVHTSTVTVSIIPSYGDVSEEDITINAGDIRIDTMRSSGAGGQHVNKTDSAVRIVHIPTGIKVECQNERSQHSNKAQAMEVLRARIFAMKLQEQQSKISQEKLKQTGTGGRSERIRTYNYPQRRITDHRINKGFFKFDAILAGDPDPILRELAEYFNGKEISNL
jgi:peptide chain release factor 1